MTIQPSDFWVAGIPFTKEVTDADIYQVLHHRKCPRCPALSRSIGGSPSAGAYDPAGTPGSLPGRHPATRESVGEELRACYTTQGSEDFAADDDYLQWQWYADAIETVKAQLSAVSES